MVTNVRFDSAFSAPETIELESSGEVRTQSLILNGKGSYLLEHPLPDDFLLKRDIWQQTPFLEIFFSTDGIFCNVFHIQSLLFSARIPLTSQTVDLFSPEYMEVSPSSLKWWRIAVWVQLVFGLLLPIFIWLVLFLAMPSWRIPATIICLLVVLFMVGITIWKKRCFEKYI